MAVIATIPALAMRKEKGAEEGRRVSGYESKKLFDAD